MRWNYSKPEGKFFLSDSKFFYFYSPSTGQVEKTKLKDADDLRLPLAFLLGKMDFKTRGGRFRPFSFAVWPQL